MCVKTVEECNGFMHFVNSMSLKLDCNITSKDNLSQLIIEDEELNKRGSDISTEEVSEHY